MKKHIKTMNDIKMKSSFARQLIEDNHTFHLEKVRILPKENYDSV